ncbi:MAG: DUF3149 domain-containing protein [Marinicella sp.]|nr:DUF3149 domain-containing protein [Xanthomonadales bacterium]
MEVFKSIFSSSIGIMSFGVIAFMLCMVVFFVVFFNNKIKQQEKNKKP